MDRSGMAESSSCENDYAPADGSRNGVEAGEKGANAGSPPPACFDFSRGEKNLRRDLRDLAARSGGSCLEHPSRHLEAVPLKCRVGHGRTDWMISHRRLELEQRDGQIADVAILQTKERGRCDGTKCSV